MPTRTVSVRAAIIVLKWCVASKANSITPAGASQDRREDLKNRFTQRTIAGTNSSSRTS